MQEKFMPSANLVCWTRGKQPPVGGRDAITFQKPKLELKAHSFRELCISEFGAW